MILDRKQQPVALPLHDFKIPELEILTSDKGIPVLLLKSDVSPIIYSELIFESGRSWENPFGVSYYAAKMLSEGTDRLTSEEITNRFESLGSYLQIMTGIDYVTVRLYSLKRNFQSSIELLFEILSQASLPEKEFEVLRQVRLHDIRTQLAKNNYFAAVKFLESVFGETHPYGTVVDPEKINEVSLEETAAYYRSSLFNRPKASLVGDIDNSISFFLQKLNELPNRQLKNKYLLSNIISKNGSQEISKEGSSQASIRIGAISIDKTYSDIHDLGVANLLLGGFFGSRLMKNVREEKGLTYGINSQITHLQNASYFLISAEVEHSKKDIAIQEIEKEVLSLQETPPSQEELQTAINYARGKFLSSLDSPLSLASLQKNEFLSQSKDYYNTFLERLEKIRPEEVSLAAQKHLRLSNKIIVN